jgi:hypothetical protein
MCLVAAAAVAMTAAGYLTVRGYLVRQADQQLRAYASDLTRQPFAVFPGAPIASGAFGPDGPGGSAASIEVRDPEGHLVMSASLGLRAVSGGSWLVIAEPVHYQVRHIPFAYGAEDSSVLVTGRARPGLTGTLVVRLSLASIGQATRRLAVTCLAVSGVVLLLVGCAAAVVIRAILRSLIHEERTAAAAAAEQALSAAAASEASARSSADRMCRAAAGTVSQLRRPVHVLHGIASCYPQRERLGPTDPGRLMWQVADEAARIDALIDDLVRLQAALPHDGPDDVGSHPAQNATNGA